MIFAYFLTVLRGRGIDRPGVVKIVFCDRRNPNVAKAGGLQSQGVKGEAVIGYRNPLTTQDLKSSSFPGR